MESGTLPAIPAPKHHPKNHAPGPFGFIRDVGGKSGPLRGRNNSASSRYSQRRAQRRWQRSSQQATRPPLDLGGRIILRWGLRRRERIAASGQQEPRTSRRAPVAHGRKSARSGASARPPNGWSERLEHRLPGEPSLLERVAQVSPLRMDRAGENIANASCASGANDVLMRSAPHRENLLDRGFNVAGVAAIWSKGRLYVVQDFAHEVPSYSAQQSGKLVGQAVDEMRQQAGLPHSSNSRRRILTRPLARWRERIVQTLTCSRPPTTIGKLSLTPRAVPECCRQAPCDCCATRAFASLQSAPAMRATRRIRPECIGSRFCSTDSSFLFCWGCRDARGIRGRGRPPHTSTMIICEHPIVLISGPPGWKLRVFSEAGRELQAVCRFGLPWGS